MWAEFSRWIPPIFVLGGIALAYVGAFWSRQRLRGTRTEKVALVSRAAAARADQA